MRTLSIAAIALVSLPAYADDLRVGAMHIEWPVGCKGTTEERTISMECPGGEHVIISPVLARSDIPEQQASTHFLAMAQDMSRKVMVPPPRRTER